MPVAAAAMTVFKVAQAVLGAVFLGFAVVQSAVEYRHQARIRKWERERRGF